MAEPTPHLAGSNPDPIAVELAELQRQIRAIRSIQATGRLWVIGTTAVVILLFAAFTFGTYAKVKSNFDDAAVQRAISQHGDEMLPLTQRMLTATWGNVMPVYRAELVRTLHDRGPDVAAKAVDRLQEIPKRSGAEFQDKMRVAFDAAVQKIGPDLKAAYPSISDDKRQQILQAFVGEQIAAQNKRIAGRVDELYTKDLVHMQQVLEKFKLPDSAASPAGRDELERQFLHTMVAMLDDQIEAAYAPAAKLDATASAAPARATLTPSTQPTALP